MTHWILNAVGIALIIYYIGFIVYFGYKAFKAAMEGRKERLKNGQS